MEWGWEEFFAVIGADDKDIRGMGNRVICVTVRLCT